MDASAVVALGEALREMGYRFVTTSPKTHAYVNRRAPRLARNMREVFGHSRPFRPSAVPPRILTLARAAGVIEEGGDELRSTIRFSSLHEGLFAHSAYPTTDADAVFFGPDTYRFCDLAVREVERAERLVDLGCGSGAAGIALAGVTHHVVLVDPNETALAFADVNARLAGVKTKCTLATTLEQVDGLVDTVLANPPYMADPKSRTYRDGGGELGEGIGVDIARDALDRLAPGGRLVLYTGSPMIAGRDVFLEAVRPVVEGHDWRYREIDPDVFGEEIAENDLYAHVERIAAVSLVVQKRR